jgi:hypothetical protein
VRNLTPGDKVRTALNGRIEDGKIVHGEEDRTLRVVSVERMPGLRQVYNLEVEELHSFAVGELGEWVHNGDDPKKQCSEGDYSSCFSSRLSTCVVGNSGLCAVGCHLKFKSKSPEVYTLCLAGCASFFAGTCIQSIKYQCNRDCN